MTATGNALELPSFLAQHHVPCRALVAAGGKKLALPTFAGRVRDCRDRLWLTLTFPFLSPLGDTISSLSVVLWKVTFLLIDSSSFFSSSFSSPPSSHFSLFLLPPAHPKTPRCIWSLTPNKDGTPGWREVPSCYLHACARLSPLEVPSGEGGAVAGVNAPQNLCLPFSGTPSHPCPSSHLSFPNSGLFQGPVRPLGQFGGRSPENRPSHSLY